MRKLFIFCFILLTIGLRAQYPAFMPEFKVMNTKVEIKEHNAVNGSVVLLRGIDSINDGNGALFQFDNTSIEPANDSTIFAVTGVSVGRWLKMSIYGGSIFNIEGDTMIVINNIKIKNILKVPLTDTTHAKKGCANIIYDTINEHFYGDVCLNGVHALWGCFDCSLTLKTNGTNNGSQTLLNIAQGSNMTITDNGTGTVTFTALTSGGSTNSNIGSGYRLAVPNTNNIKTLHAGTNVSIDSVAHANELTIASDDSDAFHTTHQYSDTCFTIIRPNGTRDTVCITGGVGGATSWTNLFSASFTAAGGVAGSTTDYGQVSGRAGGWIADETTVQFVMSEDFTASRLFVRTSTSQPAGGSLVVTFRKNASDQTLTITIPAGSAAGTFSDVTHSVSVSAGDLVDWKEVNSSGSTSAIIISIGATAVGN